MRKNVGWLILALSLFFAGACGTARAASGDVIELTNRNTELLTEIGLIAKFAPEGQANLAVRQKYDMLVSVENRK
jgi:hypothetical protein